MSRFLCLLLQSFLLVGVCLAVYEPQCMLPKTFNFEAALRRKIVEKERLRRKVEAERKRQELAEEAAKQRELREKQQEARRKQQEEANHKRQEETKRKREQQRQQQEQQKKKQQGQKKEDCPYGILGVAREASQGEIKKAYRALSLKYHPDKNPGCEVSKDNFTRLVDAYEILGDEDRRVMYDEETFGAYQSRPRNFNSKAGFYSGNSFVTSLNQTEFDRLVLCKGPFQGDEECVPWMVKFYAPWCVHCKNMVPDWKRTASTMDGTETPLGFVKFGAVNCEAEKQLCSKQEARSFPTILLYAHDAKGQDHVEKFPRGRPRTVDNLIEHAEKGIRLAHESSLQAIDGFVMEKNVTNSESTGLWIVMFEASHCVQCGSLKALLRRMSANMGGLASFGVFDCGKEPKVCQQQYISKKYPSLKMYPYKGSKGTGETLVQPGSDPLVVLPVVEKVIRMCIANIEEENALMKTLHEDSIEEPEPPQPQYQYYPEPEEKVHRVLPAGVKASSGSRYIAGAAGPGGTQQS